VCGVHEHGRSEVEPEKRRRTSGERSQQQERAMNLGPVLVPQSDSRQDGKR
jgi:hypothetical protein